MGQAAAATTPRGGRGLLLALAAAAGAAAAQRQRQRAPSLAACWPASCGAQSALHCTLLAARMSLFHSFSGSVQFLSSSCCCFSPSCPVQYAARARAVLLASCFAQFALLSCHTVLANEWCAPPLRPMCNQIQDWMGKQERRDSRARWAWRAWRARQASFPARASLAPLFPPLCLEQEHVQHHGGLGRRASLHWELDGEAGSTRFDTGGPAAVCHPACTGCCAHLAALQGPGEPPVARRSAISACHFVLPCRAWCLTGTSAMRAPCTPVSWGAGPAAGAAKLGSPVCEEQPCLPAHPRHPHPRRAAVDMPNSTIALSNGERVWLRMLSVSVLMAASGACGGACWPAIWRIASSQCQGQRGQPSGERAASRLSGM